MSNHSIETAMRHLSDRGYHVDETWLRNNEDRILIPELERIPIVCNMCGFTREVTISWACKLNEKTPCPQCRAQQRLDKKFGAGHIKILEYGGRNDKLSKLYCIPSEQVFERRIDTLTHHETTCICSNGRHTCKEVKNIVSSRGYELLGNHKDEDIIGTRKKLTLLCKEHGPFHTTFHGFHDGGHGCPKCGLEAMSEKRRFTKEEAQDKIDEVHGKGRYIIGDDYVNMKTACKILCKSCGRERFIVPKYIASGSRCSCETESKGESFTSSFLDYMGLRYEKQVKFDDCQYKNHLPFDFRVWVGNQFFLLEFDGAQHFKSIKYWGGKKNLKMTQLRDRIKNQFCEKNKIFLIRIQCKKREFKLSDRERAVKALRKAGNIMAFFSKLTRKHPWVISIEI